MIPVQQDNSSALYKSSELSRNQDSFCTTLRRDARPALFNFHGLHAPDTRSLSLILLWQCLGRGGLLWNTNLWGASCVRTPSSPLLHKTCTLSVSVVVKFHCTFWSGDHGSCNCLVLSQGFAITRAWYYVLRDITIPAYHSLNP